MKGPGTRVIDLGGDAVVPGLQDAHGHFLGLGASLSSLDLRDTPSLSSITEKVAARAAGLACRPMDCGPRLGSERLAGEDWPTRQDLDASPPTPRWC